MHLDFALVSDLKDRQEFEELVISAGACPMDVVGGRRSAPHAKYFVGSGKVEEIRSAVSAHQAEVVIFNHTLSPAQERNLEYHLKCRVVDRTGLILDIFAQRARTHEGKLQVELAQLQHLSSRLVRGWTHLERQKGGIGMRGPGETQLEMDRRMLSMRVKAIQARLEKVRKQRAQGRKARNKNEIATVSLVGYTNAGKSTLFNHLTSADVYVADQLFATLDPTLRKLVLPHAGSLILADTVGFVRDLPHDLVAAFRATLEETLEASLLLQVVDASDENRQETIHEVDAVLDHIGAGELPKLMVYNKIDLLDEKPRIDRDAEGNPQRVWVSAKTGEGFDELYQAIAERLQSNLMRCEILLPINAGRLRAELFEQNAVINERYSDQGEAILELELPQRDVERLLANAGVRLIGISKDSPLELVSAE